MKHVLSWISSLFSSPPPEVDTPAPLPQTPPLPPPEPSCFAKGVAKSLVEEPEMWKEIDDENIDYMMGMNQRVLLSVKHLTTRLIVVAGNRGSYLTVQSPYPVECNDLEWIRVEPLPVGQWHLTRQDEILLLSTIAAHPLGQYKKKIEQEKEATLRRVRMTEHFVKMGCGESPKGIEVKKD